MRAKCIQLNFLKAYFYFRSCVDWCIAVLRLYKPIKIKNRMSQSLWIVWHKICGFVVKQMFWENVLKKRMSALCHSTSISNCMHFLDHFVQGIRFFSHYPVIFWLISIYMSRTSENARNEKYFIWSALPSEINISLPYVHKNWIFLVSRMLFEKIISH